jgi:hypothetical protein
MKARLFSLASVCAVLAAGLAMADESPDSSAAGRAAPRSLNVIQNDVRSAMRAEALSRRQGPNVDEVVRLIELYRELAAHPKRDTSAVAKELGLKLRSRLGDIRDEIERRTGDRRRAVKKTAVVPAVVTPQTQVLAQQLAPGAAPGQGVQVPVVQPVVAQAIDYGPQLVELIQATISPGTWDVNGGPGSIFYYAPLRVLVVSAPDGVQEQIGGVLGQMR